MENLKWWQTAVFYQIYPRSFADGNGDGIGDLVGITSKLDYLVDLGIDAIWLSPHYPSPQFDCGYDIADYTNVEPEYGSLADFIRFLEGAHQREIRVILDLVLNHTSDQHPWFRESRASLHNPKRGWYIWRNGVNDGPPNNWSAAFDNAAWTHDQVTDQWYYHFFFAEQPDLNWRNPDVKQAMFNTVRFWLDLGVDGFRLDALGMIFEDPDLPDHPAEINSFDLFRRNITAYPEVPDPETHAYLAEQQKLMRSYQVGQPGIHELMKELRALVDEYDDRVLVGETDEISYYGDGTNELHMVFNFPLMRVNRLIPGWIRANQEDRLASLPPGSWPCNTLNNHDTARVYSRYGDGENDAKLARLSLALMLTLKGTPFLYNGEEIGMSDYPLERIDQFRDNLGVWIYRVLTTEMGESPEVALDIVKTITRDKCRTPMQWSSAPNGGFSPPEVKTWLPVHPNYADGVNVAKQGTDPGSLLNFYKRILQTRAASPALVAGDYRALNPEAEDIFAFLREVEDQRVLVILNFGDNGQALSLDLENDSGNPLFSSQERSGRVSIIKITLEPFEILILEL